MPLQDRVSRMNLFYFGSFSLEKKIRGWGGEKPESPCSATTQQPLHEVVGGLGLGKDTFLWILQDGKHQGLPKIMCDA